MHHRLNTLPLSNSFSGLSEAYYSTVTPTPFTSPARLIHFNAQAAALLDLAPDIHQDPAFAEVFTGKQVLADSQPLAMMYAGHQFGHYVSELGDGRAILLGETTNARGEKWELQLKGSGLTPYSRDGDGRAVLRSSIREYLCSEAMHGLGIPTTRALCLIGSEDEVYREQIETGAMLTRLAPSHLRFGSFEVFYYRNQHERIRTLADFVIEHHYPELADEAHPYVSLLQTVIDRTARLMAQWQSVGFAHGVMNTDNMSILGLTLDYGPFGFMEAYDPGLVCNHSDYRARYAFNQQPSIGLWNLSCLAQALLPLMELDDAKSALETYEETFWKAYNQRMANKLGFEQADETSAELSSRLLEQMHESRTDFTHLFRALADLSSVEGTVDAQLCDRFVDRARFNRWLHDYRNHFNQAAPADVERRQGMNAVNPKYVLRNYLAQIAIEKAERDKDYAEIDRLMTVLQSPYDEHPELAHYAEPPPDWADNIQVSCSS